MIITEKLLRKEVLYLNKEFASMNIVIFHVKVPNPPNSNAEIKGSHGAIDYDALNLNIKIARWSQPDANILIFTDFESFDSLLTTTKLLL